MAVPMSRSPARAGGSCGRRNQPDPERKRFGYCRAIARRATSPSPGIILAVLSLGGIAYALLQSLVLPALPEIQRSLHSSEDAVGWILTAYLLSASVATPILGRLGDMYGKERLLMIVLVVLAFGTLISALASSLGLLIAGRVIQG